MCTCGYSCIHMKLLEACWTCRCVPTVQGHIASFGPVTVLRVHCRWMGVWCGMGNTSDLDHLNIFSVINCEQMTSHFWCLSAGFSRDTSTSPSNFRWVRVLGRGHDMIRLHCQNGGQGGGPGGWPSLQHSTLPTLVGPTPNPIDHF